MNGPESDTIRTLIVPRPERAERQQLTDRKRENLIGWPIGISMEALNRTCPDIAPAECTSEPPSSKKRHPRSVFLFGVAFCKTGWSQVSTRSIIRGAASTGYQPQIEPQVALQIPHMRSWISTDASPF